jgi:hypothetical protein
MIQGLYKPRARVWVSCYAKKRASHMLMLGAGFRREQSRGKSSSVKGYLEIQGLASGLVLQRMSDVLSVFGTKPYLSDNQELREFSKANHLVKNFRLLGVILLASDELHWNAVDECVLVAFLVAVGLADDLRRVGLQLAVPRPLTIAYIFLDQRPVPAVVARVMRFRVAVATAAILVAGPDEPIRLVRVEAQHVGAERVGSRLGPEGVPGFARVCRVVVLGTTCEEVGAIGSVSMYVED